MERYPDSELKILISNIGVLMDWPAAYTPNTGPMDAFLLVQLKGRRGAPDTFEVVARLREELSERFPGVELAFDTGGMLTAALNMGEPAPIHLQVQGSDLHTLNRIAQILADEISGLKERWTYGSPSVSITRSSRWRSTASRRRWQGSMSRT